MIALQNEVDKSSYIVTAALKTWRPSASIESAVGKQTEHLQCIVIRYLPPSFFHHGMRLSPSRPFTNVYGK